MRCTERRAADTSGQACRRRSGREEEVGAAPARGEAGAAGVQLRGVELNPVVDSRGGWEPTALL